jgi:hypothetical protein
MIIIIFLLAIIIGVGGLLIFGFWGPRRIDKYYKARLKFNAEFFSHNTLVRLEQRKGEFIRYDKLKIPYPGTFELLFKKPESMFPELGFKRTFTKEEIGFLKAHNQKMFDKYGFEDTKDYLVLDMEVL